MDLERIPWSPALFCGVRRHLVELSGVLLSSVAFHGAQRCFVDLNRVLWFLKKFCGAQRSLVDLNGFVELDGISWSSAVFCGS